MRTIILAMAAVCTFASPTIADEPRFAVMSIDAAGESPSCAVIDVNADGRLDIVSGGFWYEAPADYGKGEWKKHFAREVVRIGGRLDEYSLLPAELNGDAFLDLVVCNYRSKSIQFVYHPGEVIRKNPDAPWTTKLFAEPGASETGRLVDIDGDGLLDLLPNGADYAAWWKRNPKGAAEVFTRQELPKEIAGHGIGSEAIAFGGGKQIAPIIVTPSGRWIIAPSTIVTLGGARTVFECHSLHDFHLHRDSSVPILAHDIDVDKDRDLIWGRAHHIGLYWLEQKSKLPGSDWIQHTIDTEITQSHSLLMGDLNGDGESELIAGSRVMAHDGKDVGEYDPLMLAAYQFKKESKSWKRTILVKGFPGAGGVGFGLDPKVVDIDEDGDLDIVASDRKGLFLLLNLANGETTNETSLTVQPKHLKPQVMMEFWDEKGQTQPVTKPEHWGRRRAEILTAMEEVMGKLPTPDRRVPLDAKVLETTETEKYTRKKITFASESGERVSAYLLTPKSLSAPAPGMLCLHQTTPGGKESPAGLSDRPALHYAHELANRGYVCIVPDYPSFGDYKYDFKVDHGYASGTMKAIWDNHRAVDLLEAMPEVDPDRIGVIGHSLGGHNALFTAAFDRRIKAVVTSCGFTAFHHYYKGNLKGWSSDRYMPRIASVYHNRPDEMPFDFHGVLAAIGPRAVFVCAPLRDDNFAVEGVREVEAEAGKVFSLFKAKERFVFEYPDEAHDFPDATRERAYQWLEQVLK